MPTFIPDGSIITEAQISYWMSNFGKTRAESIADLDDIESGRLIPPSDLTAIFAPLVAKGASIMQRDARPSTLTRLSTPKVMGAIAAASAAIVAATVGVGVFTTSITGNVPNTAIVAMTTATTTPCAIQNTSGSDRIILAIGVEETGTAASVGVITAVAGTGTTAFSDASHTKFVNSIITKISGKLVPSTTSTVQTAHGVWGNNEWLTFKSNSTTHSGQCRVLYY